MFPYRTFLLKHSAIVKAASKTARLTAYQCYFHALRRLYFVCRFSASAAADSSRKATATFRIVMTYG